MRRATHALGALGDPKETSVDDLLLHANGIDGATGGYLASTVSPAEIARLALGQRDDPALDDLRLRRQRAEPHLGVRRGLDANDLADAGWGVIFAQDADPAIREALAPLLDLRRAQATAKRPRYREYAGIQGYTPGLRKDVFLAANNSAPGLANPDRVPYYLLLVGDPAGIPYEFQYQLDVQYAVGRVAFETLEQYASYAASVVAAESGRIARPRSAVFFGTKNADDEATALSAEHLVAPLVAAFAARSADGWDVRAVVGADADKPRLAALAGGAETPALLFTASHGVGFPAGDPRQSRHQGALLCQEWPGPIGHVGELPETYYYSGDDARASASPAGLVSFHFACYGAGTPQFDEFSRRLDVPPREIAPRPLIAPLAQQLLGHPGGGALAFVGHVERAWAYAFVWPGAEDAQLAVFEDTLASLFDGCTVGYAMEVFNERYAELATDLTAELGAIRNGRRRDDFALARMWTAHNDARNYVIVGDPAVRLAVGAGQR